MRKQQKLKNSFQHLGFAHPVRAYPDRKLLVWIKLEMSRTHTGYSLSPLKLDRQKVAGTLMATGKTGFFECTILGSDGSKPSISKVDSNESD
jgi:hypothetical protein